MCPGNSDHPHLVSMGLACLTGLKQCLQAGKNTCPSIGAGSVSGVILSPLVTCVTVTLVAAVSGTSPIGLPSGPAPTHASNPSTGLEAVTGKNPSYRILGRAMETSASFEVWSAPSPYPTVEAPVGSVRGAISDDRPYRARLRLGARVLRWVRQVGGVVSSATVVLPRYS